MGDADAHALYNNIKRVANPRLDAAFKRAGDADEQGRYRRLADAIKAIVGEDRWRNDRTRAAAIVGVFRQAIEHKDFPEFMNGRSPDSPEATDGDGTYKGLPEREFAYVMYGFRDKELAEAKGYKPGHPEYGKPLTYQGVYKDWILKRAEESLNRINPATRTASRMLEIIWQDITLAILDLVAEAERQSVAISKAAADTKYSVPRPPLLDALRAAIEDDHRIVWVHGEPGVGKSDAVRQVLSGNEGHTLWLDCFDEDRESPKFQRLYEGIVRALVERKKEPGTTQVQLRDQLREIISSDIGPSYVVVDNYVREAFPELGIQAVYSSRLIIVSRYLPPDRLDVSTVRVKDLNDSEAQTLVYHFLPNAIDRDVDDLLKALFNRVLLLKQICLEIHNSDDLTIRAYLDALKKPGKLIRFADISTDKENQSIVDHYRFLLKRLESRPRGLLSIKYLDLLLILSGPNLYATPFQLLWDVISADSIAHAAIVEDDIENGDKIRFERDPVFEKELSQAVGRLRSIGLGETGTQDIGENALHSYQIHPLTRTVLVKLRERMLKEARRNIILFLNLRFRNRWHSRMALAGRMCYVLQNVETVMRDTILHDHEFVERHLDDCELAAALVTRAVRQMWNPKVTSTADLQEARAIAAHLLSGDSRVVALDSFGQGPVASVDDLIRIPDGNFSSTGNIGLSAALDEFIIDIFPVASAKNLLHGTTFARNARPLGLLYPTQAWQACKELPLDFGINHLADAAEVAECQESFQRQERGQPSNGEFERIEEFRKNLIYARWLVSSRQVARAHEVIQSNVESIRRHRPTSENRWIELENLRLGCDAAIRSGDIDMSFDLMAVMISQYPEVGGSRADSGIEPVLYDDAQGIRFLLLSGEIYMAALTNKTWYESKPGGRFQIPGESVLDLSEEARPIAIESLASSVLDVWNENKDIDNAEVAFEVADQALRFALIAAQLSDFSDDRIALLRQDFTDKSLALAEHRVWHLALTNFSRTISELAVEQRVYFHSDLQFWLGADLLKKNAGNADFSLASEIDCVEKLDTLPMEDLAPVSARYWSTLAEHYGLHWYHVDRYKVFVACLAKLSGYDAEHSFVSSGMDAALQSGTTGGRRDWIEIIESINDDPHELLRLLAR